MRRLRGEVRDKVLVVVLLVVLDQVHVAGGVERENLRAAAADMKGSNMSGNKTDET